MRVHLARAWLSARLSAPAGALAMTSRYVPPVVRWSEASLLETADGEARGAWCLDMPCTVDADPSKATCLCKQVSTPKQAYIIVTDAYRDSTCTTDIWSSAKIEDVLQITGFLQDSDELKPDLITIVGVGTEKH